MKKALAVLVVGVALLMFVVPAFAGPVSKVTVCHVTDFFDIPQNAYTTVVGHWINVSENALPEHQSHGDFVDKEITGEDGLNVNDIDHGPVIFGLTWRQVATNNGLDLEGVNCAGFVLDF